MKKYILLILLISFSLIIAQGMEEEVENENIMTGLILAVENNTINFEEMWLRILPPTAKQAPVIVTNANEELIRYNNLIAPCLAEITYEYVKDEIAPRKIKVLKQYQYDSKGFIKEKK